jgi:hypothetical protein
MAWDSALRTVRIGALGAVSSKNDRGQRELWSTAAVFAQNALCIMREAELIKVPSLEICGAPNLGSSRDTARAAAELKLPADPVFYDFRHPREAAWVLTDDEPLELTAALCWREGATLSVAPVWAPLDSEGRLKCDPEDALGRAPIARCVFGSRDEVLPRLEPGTFGACADSGELFSWGLFDDGSPQDRTAHRTLRTSMRVVEAIAALDFAPSPRRTRPTAQGKREALARGTRVPRAYSLAA